MGLLLKQKNVKYECQTDIADSLPSRRTSSSGLAQSAVAPRKIYSFINLPKLRVKF
jgi:hypothetical protein